MTCVYHLCAPDFRGDVLYPLEGLRLTLPDIYARERVKYIGRESVLSFVRRQQARGERALGFVFIPHVLVAAPIDVSGLQSQPLADA
jgi:hypothetical protein